MSKSLTMQARIDAYLAERRRLGFSLETSGITAIVRSVRRSVRPSRPTGDDARGRLG